MEVANHQIFQKRQLSVKEMPPSRDDCDRQYLGPGPVHHRRQRHGVVLLAMHHQRAQVGFRRDGGDGETAGRRADQHGLVHAALGPESGQRMAGNKRAEREPGQRNALR